MCLMNTILLDYLSGNRLESICSFLYYEVFVDDHWFLEMSITSWNENELHSRYSLKLNPIVKGRDEFWHCRKKGKHIILILYVSKMDQLRGMHLLFGMNPIQRVVCLILHSSYVIAILIDPGEEPNKIRDEIQKHKVTISILVHIILFLTSH